MPLKAQGYPVTSFRPLSMILGILGSIAALLISGIFLLVYLVITLSNMFEKVPTPNTNPPIELTIQIFYYLAAGVLGISGSTVSSFKPRARSAILLVSGIAVLVPGSLLFPGPMVFSVFTLLELGSPVLLFSGGLLALIENQTKRPERPIATDQREFPNHVGSKKPLRATLKEDFRSTFAYYF
jgi:hypothetical protein